MSRGFGGVDALKLGTSQSIACATTSTAISSAFGAQTYTVRLSNAGAQGVFYRIGDGTQTAVTTDPFLPTTWVEYVRVTPGQRISAITSTSTSTLIVTEGTQ